MRRYICSDYLIFVVLIVVGCVLGSRVACGMSERTDLVEGEVKSCCCCASPTFWEGNFVANDEVFVRLSVTKSAETQILLCSYLPVEYLYLSVPTTFMFMRNEKRQLAPVNSFWNN